MRKWFMLMAGAFLASTLTSQAWFWDKKGKEEKKADAPEVTVPADFTAVDSSVLKAVKYDAGSETLTLQFVEGDVYEYSGVPQKVYDSLMAADSKGSYFQDNIKDKFKAEKK